LGFKPEIVKRRDRCPHKAGFNEPCSVGIAASAPWGLPKGSAFHNPPPANRQYDGKDKMPCLPKNMDIRAGMAADLI
jgi:hypothetical protein